MGYSFFGLKIEDRGLLIVDFAKSREGQESLLLPKGTHKAIIGA